MLLTLIYNMGILAIIMFSLRKRRNEVKTAKADSGDGNKSEIGTEIRILVCLSFLLGVTWVFGLLAVIVDHISIHYLFAIFNTLQGLAIFVFHFARVDKIRDSWSNSFTSSVAIIRERATSLTDSRVMSSLKRFSTVSTTDTEMNSVSNGTSLNDTLRRSSKISSAEGERLSSFSERHLTDTLRSCAAVLYSEDTGGVTDSLNRYLAVPVSDARRVLSSGDTLKPHSPASSPSAGSDPDPEANVCPESTTA